MLFPANLLSSSENLQFINDDSSLHRLYYTSAVLHLSLTSSMKQRANDVLVTVFHSKPDCKDASRLGKML